MSKPGNAPSPIAPLRPQPRYHVVPAAWYSAPHYFTGQDAIDVSTITGYPWAYARVESRRPHVPYLPMEDAWMGFVVGWAIVARCPWISLQHQTQEAA